MDLLTISEVKNNDGYLGHELFDINKKKHLYLILERHEIN